MSVGGGKLLSYERGDCRPVTVPCGGCIGCRLQRSSEWAMRCMHEAQMHESNSFVTLTYDEEHVPRSLEYTHFQKFIDRLRKRLKRGVRFYVAGEYGERTFRPHFHALLFGVDFDDRVYYRKSSSGSRLYKSAFLDDCWHLGLCSFGDVSFQSAGYVARYCLKKVTGANAAEHYKRVDPETGEVYSVVPEFSRMSLRPGIGAKWFEKYKKECFDGFDRVVCDGFEHKPPRYYKKLLKESDGLRSDEVDFERAQFASKEAFMADSTERRLKVRETVRRSKLRFLKRDLE